LQECLRSKTKLAGMKCIVEVLV